VKNKLLTRVAIFRLIAGIFMADIIKVFLTGLIDVGLKMMESISLDYLLKAIISENYDRKVVWAIIGSLSLFLSSIFRHNAWMYGQKMNAKVRGLLVSVIFEKLTKLSSFSIQKADLGKVINVVSADLISVE
jgi:ATP-binding cassette, subfamily C (CFTR/MRP), member 4